MKSGYLDKPRSNVLVKQKWPHMNQDPRYVTETLTFNQLNFCQFIGGECRTILRTEDPVEIWGRLRVLSKVAYLYNQCASWERARAAYFTIVGSIEEGEVDWGSSFGHYDLMCPAPVYELRHAQRADRAPATKPRNMQGTSKRDFYCMEFQWGECQLQAPHKAWIRNAYEMVDHFCAQCYRAKAGKQAHLPGSDQCVKK